MKLHSNQSALIALIGYLNFVFLHFAYGAAGDLDTTFAGSGTTRLGFEGGQDFGQAVAVQPDGRVVVAGYSGISSLANGHIVLTGVGVPGANHTVQGAASFESGQLWNDWHRHGRWGRALAI
jgi:hypothetical protein